MVLKRLLLCCMIMGFLISCNDVSPVGDPEGEVFFKDVNYYEQNLISDLTGITNDTPSVIFVEDIEQIRRKPVYYQYYSVNSYMRYEAPSGEPDSVCWNNFNLENSELNHFFWNKKILNYYKTFNLDTVSAFITDNFWQIHFPDGTTFDDTLHNTKIIDNFMSSAGDTLKSGNDLELFWDSDHSNKVLINYIVLKLNSHLGISFGDTLVADNGHFTFGSSFMDYESEGENCLFIMDVTKGNYVISKNLNNYRGHTAHFVKMKLELSFYYSKD